VTIVGTRIGGNRLALICGALLIALCLFSFAGPLLRSVDPDAVDLGNQAAGMSSAHPLGTDESGRDILTRLMYGGRVSLAVGIGAVVFALLIGISVGGLAGFYLGWLDTLLMRVADGMLAIPAIFIMLTMLTFFGTSLPTIVLVIGLTSWMGIARLVRGEVLAVRHDLYVEAARALGARDVAIFLRHILPQLVPTIAVSATLGVATAILTESALSFLGLGVQPPAASWGNMLSGAQNYLFSAPRLAVYPGVMILLTVVAFNVVGDGVRDAFDSR
jgi:peptide/nickel transport system permease protein